MKGITRPLAGLACLAVVSGFALASDGDAESQTTAMKFKSAKKWDIVLPTEQWTSIVDEIAIPHSGGNGFVAELAGPMKLEIDTNADGKVDDDVKGQGGFVKLRGKHDDGSSFDYAVRIKLEDNAWKYGPGGWISGKLAGTTVRIIDQDNNGRFDDFGSDAMVIGSGVDASLLSRVVNIDGALYEFEVDARGTQASITPWAGETGKLDMASEFESNGKLVSAVVTDSSRNYSFNLADSKGGMTLPAGTYRFTSGFAQKAGESVFIGSGKMRELKVGADVPQVLEWGGPVQADFSWSAGAGVVTVNKDVRYYGRGMAEYHTFSPNAKSPKIIVREAKGKVVLEGRFPGC